MKNTLLTLTLIFLGAHLFSQQIIEQSKTMSLGSQNGLYIELDGADKKLSEKLWKNYIKEYSKKVKKSKNEYYTEEGRIPIVNGSAELTLYSSFEEGRNQTTLYTWVDLGGVFLNSEDHLSQYDGMNQFLTDFYFQVRKEVIKKEIETEEKLLKNLNKDLSKLANKNEDYHNDIVKAQEKISQAESKIEKNLANQDDKRIEIQKQKEKIEDIIKKLNEVGKKS